MSSPEDNNPGLEPSSEDGAVQTRATDLMRDMTSSIGKLSEGQSAWVQWVWTQDPRFSFGYNRIASRNHGFCDETLQIKVRNKDTGEQAAEFNYSTSGLRDHDWNLTPASEGLNKMVGSSTVVQIEPADLPDLKDAQEVLQQELEARLSRHAD